MIDGDIDSINSASDGDGSDAALRGLTTRTTSADLIGLTKNREDGFRPEDEKDPLPTDADRPSDGSSVGDAPYSLGAGKEQPAAGSRRSAASR